jgi:hypothetical protein
MNDTKIKIKKLVALYKDNPMSNEGLAAYTKAKGLIEKYKLDYSEFGLNDFITIYQEKPKVEEKFKTDITKYVKPSVKPIRVEGYESSGGTPKLHHFKYSNIVRDNIKPNIKKILFELFLLAIEISEGDYCCFLNLSPHVSNIQVHITNKVSNEHLYYNDANYKGSLENKKKLLQIKNELQQYL